MNRTSHPVKGASGMPVLTEPDARVHASRRVIEVNGGRLASASHGILRIWVSTSAA